MVAHVIYMKTLEHILREYIVALRSLACALRMQQYELFSRVYTHIFFFYRGNLEEAIKLFDKEFGIVSYVHGTYTSVQLEGRYKDNLC